MSSARVHRLFVCATFLPGEADHPILADAECLGSMRTARGYSLVDLGPLGALIEGGLEDVVGELWLLDYETMTGCDIRRGHPHLCHRAPVKLADGTTADAYFLQDAQARGRRRIKGGDWLGRFRPRTAPQPGALVEWAKGRHRT